MKKLMLIGLAMLLVIFMMPGVASAASDIYKDAYTTEDSTGNWTFTGNLVTSGSVAGKTGIVMIEDSSDTVSSVTVARTGYLFVVRSHTGSSAPCELTLPNAATGLTYTFTTGTDTSIMIRPYNTANTIMFGHMELNGGDCLRSELPPAASTGTSVTLVGSIHNGSNMWFVTSMYGNWGDVGLQGAPE